MPVPAIVQLVTPDGRICTGRPHHTHCTHDRRSSHLPTTNSDNRPTQNRTDTTPFPDVDPEGRASLTPRSTPVKRAAGSLRRSGGPAARRRRSLRTTRLPLATDPRRSTARRRGANEPPRRTCPRTPRGPCATVCAAVSLAAQPCRKNDATTTQLPVPCSPPRCPSPPTRGGSTARGRGAPGAGRSRDAGHADINVTFRIYTHTMALRDGDREQLRALVSGGVCAPMCTGDDFGGSWDR